MWKPSLEKAVAGGCSPAATPAEAAKGVEILGLMVVNVKQVEDVLFGEAKVAEGECRPRCIVSGAYKSPAARRERCRLLYLSPLCSGCYTSQAGRGR